MSPDSTQPRGRNHHVVVVGAGIVGASLAFELASRHVQVTVLDETGPLAGATSKSFAWVTNQAFFRATDPVPVDRARAYFHLHRLGHNAWRRLAARCGDALGVRWHGAVQWADDPPEIARLETELGRRQRWGSPSYAIGRTELMELLPDAQPGPVSVAFYTPDEATVNPFAAVPTLLDTAIGMGAVVEAPRRVTGLEQGRGDRVIVHHDHGDVECDQVIVAAGRQTPDLASLVGINVPLVESVGDLVHLEPQEPFLEPLVLAPRVHALQRHDGRVVLARHYTGAPVSDDDQLDVEALLDTSTTLFPRLKDAAVEKVTSGRRILPADGLPIIGRSQQVSSAWAIATNAGISIGPALAQLLVTEMLDGVRTDLLNDYRAERFARGCPELTRK